MRNQTLLIFFVTLALIGTTATAIDWFHHHQNLGVPGIKATPIPGSIRMHFDLPAHVLDFTSTNVPEAEIVTNTLPKDTSFAQRCYTAPDGFWVNANVVLMGMDRTSIHKAEYCLVGQGWDLDKNHQTVVPIAIGGEHPYTLPVAKWVISRFVKTQDGHKQEIRGLYVYWFVAHDEQTTSHAVRAWWLARDLLTTGILQRWAYVSYFAVCLPGQEDVTFDRMKQLIAASVPKFQLSPTTTTMASQ
jgi:Protein of unknown function (DUF3485)